MGSDGRASRRYCRARFSSRLGGPQDGQPFEVGPDAGSLPDAFAPHSPTAAHMTTPALAPHAPRSGPLNARPAGLRHARSRTAVSASETTEHGFSSSLGDPQDGQPCQGCPTKPFSTPHVELFNFDPPDRGGVSDTVPSPKRNTKLYIKPNAGDGREPSPTVI